MAATAEMLALMREESLKEMEAMGKRAEPILGEVDMRELMAEETERDLQTMYSRGERLGRK